MADFKETYLRKGLITCIIKKQISRTRRFNCEFTSNHYLVTKQEWLKFARQELKIICCIFSLKSNLLDLCKKYMFILFIITQQWNVIGCWDSVSIQVRQEQFPFHTLNIMAVDTLATQGARVSAAMMLTFFSRNIPLSQSFGLFSLEWSDVVVCNFDC